MRLTRFCSQDEYNKFINGETLINFTDHCRGGEGGSTSVGFCFSPDDPKTAWRYLKGNVACDVCMVVEIDPATLLKTKGKYLGYPSKGRVTYKTEYCTPIYSKDTVKLVKNVPMKDIAPDYEIEVARQISKLIMDYYKTIRK